MSVSLDEPSELLTASKVVCIVSVALNALAIYLVLTRSSEFRVYSWFLLNYLVCCKL